MKKNLILAVSAIMAATLFACGVDDTENNVKITDIVVESPDTTIEEPGNDIDEPDYDENENDKTQNDSELSQGEETGYGDTIGEEEELEELIESLRVTIGEDEAYETLYSNKKALEDILELEGTWNRTQVHSSFSATVEVLNVTQTGFDYYVDAYYYMNMGMLQGQAFFVNDNTAISKVDFGWDEETSDNEWIMFCFENDLMYVYPTGSGADLGFGMNVSMDGCYTLEQPEYTNAMVLEDTFSEEELTAVCDSMSGEEYLDFLFITENGGVTPEWDDEGYLLSVEGNCPGYGGYNITMNKGEVVEYSF